MSALYITVPIAIVIALGFLFLFMWSVRNRDYEDPEMPKYKMLFNEKDDVDTSITKNKKKNK
ncbi:MAG: cbb3-type cytochrome oxidase assembly protein CcoS [Spirochaetia bacterium]|nr:cbb3-type cytochrome oxidase assembly protein CcoS [Spirochaetia bacterium]